MRHDAPSWIALLAMRLAVVPAGVARRRRAGVDRGLHRRRLDDRPDYDVSVDVGGPGSVTFETFERPLVLVRRVGRRRQLRPRVAAARRRGLAPVLLRPLGVDERGLALGVRRALGLGGVPLRALGARPVLRLGLGAGLRVGAGVGVVADLGRRHRLGAARARALGLRDRVPVRRLLVDLRPDRCGSCRCPSTPSRTPRATRAAGTTRPRRRPRARRRAPPPAGAATAPALAWGGPAPRLIAERTGRALTPARIVAAPSPGARARPGRDLGVPSRCALLARRAAAAAAGPRAGLRRAGAVTAAARPAPRRGARPRRWRPLRAAAVATAARLRPPAARDAAVARRRRSGPRRRRRRAARRRRRRALQRGLAAASARRRLLGARALPAAVAAAAAATAAPRRRRGGASRAAAIAATASGDRRGAAAAASSLLARRDPDGGLHLPSGVEVLRAHRQDPLDADLEQDLEPRLAGAGRAARR